MHIKGFWKNLKVDNIVKDFSSVEEAKNFLEKEFNVEFKIYYNTVFFEHCEVIFNYTAKPWDNIISDLFTSNKKKNNKDWISAIMSLPKYVFKNE